MVHGPIGGRFATPAAGMRIVLAFGIALIYVLALQTAAVNMVEPIDLLVLRDARRSSTRSA